MICCIGLLAGFAIGSFAGGPWMWIAPVAGFIGGLAIDTKVVSRISSGKSEESCPRCLPGGGKDEDEKEEK
ncbi:hypothetical protein AKJ63_00545 [candidate division MSBL1 archaeon SCGC-AAA259D18]|uniref:Uncharacterized protein n=1 Tax=candidate division MSBL1 archaeon SCGC-AAA259D18 TaxID=1698262 RepID=A0A133UCJ8_9EURY|nr:hypothetical protein AKJ63_00545 [candidate division MSBL1 archaeon SCGC-AAA259D18]